jgi:3'-5' exoribonuclease
VESKDAHFQLVHRSLRLPSTLYSICFGALSDPLWLVAPASGAKGKHHCFKGGLSVHTLEVVNYVDNLALGFPHDRHDELATAAILHDYLKVREYGWDDEKDEPTKLPYRHEIRHVAGSFAWWAQQAARYDLDQEVTDFVGHLMLSHHGRIEWGSPAEPRTREALILHTADMLSARFTPEGKWRS